MFSRIHKHSLWITLASMSRRHRMTSERIDSSRYCSVTMSWKEKVRPKPGLRKSSPWGTIEQPIHPICIAIAAEVTFVARCVDVDVKFMRQVLTRVAEQT